MLALIDTDILLYEIASICEYPKDDPIKSFDYAKAAFDGRVEEIVRRSGADDYLLFLTGDTNFRNEVATVKVYKGNRKSEKPFHYYNLKAYAKALGAVIWEGLEADDVMSVYQTDDMSETTRDVLEDWPEGHDFMEEEVKLATNTIICSRDKDLRQVPGYHYGWECGPQPEFKTQWVDELGSIELVQKHKEDGTVKSSKIVGTGAKFFWSQVLTGDPVDNIPGLPRCGAVKAYEVLGPAGVEFECRSWVKDLYIEKYGDDWLEALTEQAQLCWMVREVDSDGNPVMWRWDE